MVEWLRLAERVGEDRFSEALVEAVHDSEYFPVIARIKRALGITGEQKSEAEQQVALATGDAAWLLVEDHIRKWGTSGDPHYKGGKEYRPPRLPDRIAHAVRVVGGLEVIAYVADSARPFMKRDFVLAWQRYEDTTAAYNALQLEMPAAASRLLESGQRAAAEPPEEKTGDVNVGHELHRMINKKFERVREMTDVEWKDRQEMLRQQAEQLKAKEKEKPE